jgi:hypothetical protein
MLPAILDFLAAIGLPARATCLDAPTFLPGIRISRGELLFDPARLRWPCDLLHEAAHVALVPAARRCALDDALGEVEQDAGAGEVEAIAWSWAAIVHLGLDYSALFHPDGYRGQSAALMLTYSLGVFPGAAGLARLGLTATGGEARDRGVAPYPHMLRWLRE